MPPTASDEPSTYQIPTITATKFKFQIPWDEERAEREAVYSAVV